MNKEPTKIQDFIDHIDIDHLVRILQEMKELTQSIVEIYPDSLRVYIAKEIANYIRYVSTKENTVIEDE